MHEATVLWLMRPGEPETQSLFARSAWMDDGACVDEPTELFFPTRGEPAAPARAVCARCPVAEQCLAYALSDPEILGVWGGTSERQRRAMRSMRSQDPKERLARPGAHLIAAGEQPLLITKRLGQASASFTLDRYGHLFEQAGAQAASAVAAMVDGL